MRCWRLFLLIPFVAVCLVSAVPALAVPPVIEEVKIDRGRDTNSTGLVSYHQRVSARITVTDQTVACVVIGDPDGGQYALSVCAQGGWPDFRGTSPGNDLWFYITQDEADYSVNLIWYEGNRLVPPPPGSYRIRIGVNGSDTEVVFDTPPAPPIEDAYPMLDAPGADGVIGDAAPTFRWSNPTSNRTMQLTYAPSPQVRPDIDGSRIVWADGRDGCYGIRMYDLNTREYAWIAQGDETQVLPSISGDAIVYLDDLTNNWAFYTVLDDLPTGAKFLVSEHPTVYADPAYLWPPAVDGSLIAYTEPVSWNQYTLSLYDLSVDSDGDGIPNWQDDDTPSPDPARRQLGSINSSQKQPRISGRRIVYVDNRSGSDNVYLYDLDLNREFALSASSYNQETPDISGNYVVWADYRSGNVDIYLYDLSVDSNGNGIPNWQEAVRPDPDPALVNLTPDSGLQCNPAIRGDLVVWEDQRYGGWSGADIFMYDMTTGATTEITHDASHQSAPRVSSDGLVVWQDNRMGTWQGWDNWDIFAWGPAVSGNAVRVREEGSPFHSDPLGEDGGQVWYANTGDATEVAYNFDGGSTRSELLPGYSYFWQVNAWRLDMDSPHDTESYPWANEPRVQMWTSQQTYSRFSEDQAWAALPDLPGRIGYTGQMWGDASYDADSDAAFQYGTDITKRRWLGPECAEKPSWSWDGSQLLYRVCDFGIWVESPVGTPATQIPDEDAWADVSWSPDATSVVYCEGSTDDGRLGIWTRKVDGSDGRLLVPARGNNARRPNWSPDGVWIAYDSCCDPSGHNVWLIRPDGSQDHPIEATGVVGYPGYVVTWMAGNLAWSPDAKRLGVDFSAQSADGSGWFDGIGTISREGGKITVAFISPPEIVCCPAPRVEAWAPDGKSLLFSSGHHLAPDPDWPNAKLEMGVELWMVDANGKGAPTRLTYDHSYTSKASWWAPNSLVGAGVSIAKGDATATFAQVTRPGSTRINVTPDCPAPAPAGYAFTGDLWNGATTAQYQGSITVALHYGASLVGRESSLALLQWDAAKGKWQDITTRPIDKANRVIRGQCRSLSTFAIAVKTR